jgi:hypothetical protein
LTNVAVALGQFKIEFIYNIIVKLLNMTSDNENKNIYNVCETCDEIFDTCVDCYTYGYPCWGCESFSHISGKGHPVQSDYYTIAKRLGINSSYEEWVADVRAQHITGHEMLMHPHLETIFTPILQMGIIRQKDKIIADKILPDYMYKVLVDMVISYL